MGFLAELILSDLYVPTEDMEVFQILLTRTQFGAHIMNYNGRELVVAIQTNIIVWNLRLKQKHTLTNGEVDIQG